MAQVTPFQRQASHDELVERARQLVPHFLPVGGALQTDLQLAPRAVVARYNSGSGDLSVRTGIPYRESELGQANFLLCFLDFGLQRSDRGTLWIDRDFHRVLMHCGMR